MQKAMKKGYTESEATHKAEALCVSSEHCVAQISEKLAKWGLDAEVANRVIDRLVDEGYIDEKRFARAYALDKFRFNKWGRTRIRRELRVLGISNADSLEGINSIAQEDYHSTLSELLEAKRRTLKAASSFELNGKLVRFALGRGYEMDEIMRCLPEGEQAEVE